MRHRKRDIKLGRSTAHLDALVASLVCGLIREKRIATTLAKAKLARRAAEKATTLARRGGLAARRLLLARLRREDCVGMLFDEIAPHLKERKGGYTRIVKTHRRRGDAAEMAIVEWVDVAAPVRARKKKDKDGEEKTAT